MKKRVLALALAAVMAVSAFAGCGGSTDTTTTAPTTTQGSGNTDATTAPTTTAEPAAKLTILLSGGDHSHDDNPQTIEFRKRIEEYTNTEITWELYDLSVYYEKLTLKYASGEMATIMVTDQNTEFNNACQYNVFWDITDYIDLFDNLTVIPESTRLAASMKGKIYGVPRARANVGRMATSFRQDWADALNIGTPETIEDLYDMAVQFTNNDPDQNGKNDTYAFAWDSWTGALTHMMCWWGVPNNWGLNANGDLVHYSQTEEFKTALKWMRQVYSEGLVPQDFRSTAAGKARGTYVQTGMCGIYIQCADDIRKAHDNMVGTAEAPGLFPNASWTYIVGVDAGHGIKVKPQNNGYAGFVAIPRSMSPTEDDLMNALQFLNDINDAEMTNLINYGIEGQDWDLGEDGYVYIYTADERTAKGLGSGTYRNGYNQMVPYFHNADESAKLVGVAQASDIRQREQEIYALNKQYLVADYSTGLISDKNTEVGADLQAIIDNAMMDYITGIIDDTALQGQIEQWWSAGGEIVTQEMNAQYDLYNN